MRRSVLNSREKRRMVDRLRQEYGVDEGVFLGFDMFLMGGDLWVSTRDCLLADTAGLRVDSVGLQLLRDGRPTVHGVQLFFKSAMMTELTEEQALAFIAGKAVNVNGRLVSYRGRPLDLARETAEGLRRVG